MDIKKIRDKIDEIDREILDLLKERFSLLPEIVEYKKENNLPIKDEAREREVIKDKVEKAVVLGINSDFTKDLFELIMKESRRIQDEK